MEEITIKEAAKRLGYKTAATIWGMIRHNPAFPRPVYVGKNAKLIWEDVQAWKQTVIDPVRRENAERLRQHNAPVSK